MTREDKIRSMTVEELAELLFHRGNGQEYCYGICVRQEDAESEAELEKEEEVPAKPASVEEIINEYNLASGAGMRILKND